MIVKMGGTHNDQTDDTILDCTGKPPTCLVDGKEVAYDYWEHFAKIHATRCNQSKDKPSDNPLDLDIFPTEMTPLHKLYTKIDEYGPCMYCRYQRVPLGIRYDLPNKKSITLCKMCHIKISIPKRYIEGKKNSNGEYVWNFRARDKEAVDGISDVNSYWKSDIVYSLTSDKIEIFGFRKEREAMLRQDGFL